MIQHWTANAVVGPDLRQPHNWLNDIQQREESWTRGKRRGLSFFQIDSTSGTS